ncbi:hypothetical protein DEO72_LG10g1543 [Vigna unguiculata]|uniref:Uncharacterized protein n=1 Tax=Vigna unguiculata TaxID=3917 RepID=A0A4D6NDT3_VIGUN|nr:hypothetical protein DEO72_LG10g1543 [Vigna unguiculata]
MVVRGTSFAEAWWCRFMAACANGARHGGRWNRCRRWCETAAGCWCIAVAGDKMAAAAAMVMEGEEKIRCCSAGGARNKLRGGMVVQIHGCLCEWCPSRWSVEQVSEKFPGKPFEKEETPWRKKTISQYHKQGEERNKKRKV